MRVKLHDNYHTAATSSLMGKNPRKNSSTSNSLLVLLLLLWLLLLLLKMSPSTSQSALPASNKGLYVSKRSTGGGGGECVLFCRFSLGLDVSLRVGLRRPPC